MRIPHLAFMCPICVRLEFFWIEVSVGGCIYTLRAEYLKGRTATTTFQLLLNTCGCWCWKDTTLPMLTDNIMVMYHINKQHNFGTSTLWTCQYDHWSWYAETWSYNRRYNSCIRILLPTISCLNAGWLTSADRCSLAVQNILACSRKDCTSCTCAVNWKKFFICSVENQGSSPCCHPWLPAFLKALGVPC